LCGIHNIEVDYLAMKNFKDYNDFAAYTIAENLRAIQLCLTTPKVKNSNSCYGMSVVILLSSVIDTLGMFYRNGNRVEKITETDVKNNKLGKVSAHFKAFYDKFLVNVCDEHFFMGEFYEFARCRATHNNVLGPKLKITINKSSNGKVFEKKHRRASTYVYLNELYKIVKDAYDVFISEQKIVLSETPQPTTGNTIPQS